LRPKAAVILLHELPHRLGAKDIVARFVNVHEAAVELPADHAVRFSEYLPHE